MVNPQSAIRNPQWRAQLSPADRPARLAYGPLKGEDLKRLPDVLDLYAWWNKCLSQGGPGGRNRVRVVTYERVRLVRQLLVALSRGGLSADDVAECIQLYSRQEWQKKTRHWMEPDHFFTAGRIARWLEIVLGRKEAEEAGNGERGTGNGKEEETKSAQVRKLEAEIAEHQRIKAENEGLKRRFEALSADDRNELCREALEELVILGRPRGRVTPFEVQRQAMALMKRRATDNGQRETGNRERGTGEEA